jgi:transposase
MKTVQELCQRETRRMRAYELWQAGWKQKDIAVVLGVTKGAVSQWMSRARTGGVEALQRHPAPGAASRLSAEQLQRLPEVLKRGARWYGYSDENWTYRRMVEIIEREFGVHFVEQHIPRLMKKIGWRRYKRLVGQATQHELTHR